MSTTTKQHDENDDIPPGDSQNQDYHATEGRRGGGRGEFLWFVTADRAHDLILPLADIRRMDAPAAGREEVAYIHFSGVSVALSGVNLRRVLHRIAMQRCSALYQLRAGQTRPDAGEPVIEGMRFIDLTKARPKDEADG
jgi:hypothetical protein